MIARLRILTRKSKLNFGKHSELTVQRMLELHRHKELIKYYFTKSPINFTDDILDELKVTKEYRIDKPSINWNMYSKFNKNSYYYHNRNEYTGGSDKLIKSNRISKEELVRLNRGLNR